MPGPVRAAPKRTCPSALSRGTSGSISLSVKPGPSPGAGDPLRTKSDGAAGRPAKIAVLFVAFTDGPARVAAKAIWPLALIDGVERASYVAEAPGAACPVRATIVNVDWAG